MQSSKGSLYKNLVEAYTGFVDTCSKDAKLLWEKARAYEPLPQYEEGKEKEFALAMMDGSRHSHLADVVKDLECEVDTTKAAATLMGIEAAAIIPEINVLETDIRRYLTTCCLTTCVRILTSKAAQNNSKVLQQSVDKTIAFAKDLTLPSKIMKDMETLSANIRKASQTRGERKRSRSPR